MSRRTAVIVAWHFPPGAGIGGRRPQQLLERLPDHGWDVRVVTARLPEGTRADPRVVETARGKLGEYVRAVLPSSDEPLFEQWAGAPSQGAGAGDSVKARAMRAARGLLLLPDEHAPWAILGRSAAKEIDRADAVISTSPPFSAHLLGRWLARHFGCRHVVDYRDPYSGNAGWPAGRLDRPLREAIDGRILRTADAVVTVSEGFAEGLAGLGARQPHVVRNAWDDADRAEGDSPAADARVVLAQTGTLYREYSDDAARLREALAGRDVDVVHCGRGGEVLGVGEDRGLVSREEAAALRASASALLLFAAGGEANRGWIPAKLYDYIAARRPVLVVGDPAGDVRRILQEAGLPEPASTVAEIGARLDALVAAQAAGTLAALAADADAVESFGPDRLAADYAALLDGLSAS